MANEVYRISHEGDAAGQLVVNTSWWVPLTATEPAPDDAHCTAFLEAAATKWRTWMLPILNIDYIYRRSLLYEFSDYILIPNAVPGEPDKVKLVPSRQFISQTSANVTGGDSGDSLPLTVASVIHWNTGRAGRRRRGRIKLGPLDKARTSDNGLTPAAITAFGSAAGNYSDEIVAGTPAQQWDMVVFSPTTLATSPVELLLKDATTPVTGWTVATVLGTQRTRKLRSGAR